MPVVSVRYNPKISHAELKALLPTLSTTLAKQLTCKHDGKDIVITPKMVKVRFDVASELDTFADLHIEVEARAFEARFPKLNSYSAELAAAIAPLIKENVSISVWYKLCRASWYPETINVESAIKPSTS